MSAVARNCASSWLRRRTWRHRRSSAQAILSIGDLNLLPPQHTALPQRKESKAGARWGEAPAEPVRQFNPSGCGNTDEPSLERMRAPTIPTIPGALAHPQPPTQPTRAAATWSGVSRKNCSVSCQSMPGLADLLLRVVNDDGRLVVGNLWRRTVPLGDHLLPRR